MVILSFVQFAKDLLSETGAVQPTWLQCYFLKENPELCVLLLAGDTVFVFLVFVD